MTLRAWPSPYLRPPRAKLTLRLESFKVHEINASTRIALGATFVDHKEYALSLGVSRCEAGRFVRSSYYAHEHVGAPPRAAAASG